MGVSKLRIPHQNYARNSCRHSGLCSCLTRHNITQFPCVTLQFHFNNLFHCHVAYYTLWFLKIQHELLKCWIRSDFWTSNRESDPMPNNRPCNKSHSWCNWYSLSPQDFLPRVTVLPPFLKPAHCIAKSYDLSHCSSLDVYLLWSHEHGDGSWAHGANWPHHHNASVNHMKSFTLRGGAARCWNVAVDMWPIQKVVRPWWLHVQNAKQSGYGPDDWGPSRRRRYSLRHHVQTGSGPTQSPMQGYQELQPPHWSARNERPTTSIHLLPKSRTRCVSDFPFNAIPRHVDELACSLLNPLKTNRMCVI